MSFSVDFLLLKSIRAVQVLILFVYLIQLFKIKMSDGRKRNSGGSEYKKLREEKKAKEEDVLKKTSKLDAFFPSIPKKGKKKLNII